MKEITSSGLHFIPNKYNLTFITVGAKMYMSFSLKCLNYFLQDCNANNQQ